MDSSYRPDLGADVTVDDDGIVRSVLHSQSYWDNAGAAPRSVAVAYLRAMAPELTIAESALTEPEQAVDHFNPREAEVSYRLAEDKQAFDAHTFGFAQTDLNLPVWGAGVTVTVKENPSRVVHSDNTSIRGLDAALPSESVLERWRAIFDRAGAAISEDAEPAREDVEVRRMVGFRAPRRGTVTERDGRGVRINGGRFWVYRYEAARRVENHPHQPDQPAAIATTVRPDATTVRPAVGSDAERDDVHPSLPLPPVSEEINDGGDYVVAELLFTAPLAPFGSLNWRALIEVETGSVLYLRALVAGVDGLVFTYDPITSTGNLANTAAASNAVLNPLRDNVTLANLGGPILGIQLLSGSRVRVSDDDVPTVAPPAQIGGGDFDYDTRSNDFAAVNAYYHADSLFHTLESLGFNLATYFDGTAFPVHVDHRAHFGDANGVEVNAFCGGDLQGDGIGLVGFCLGDTADTAHPIGRALDKWVHWHELGGHGILWDHVNSPNLGFSHSAGDGLAALQNDPESLLRGLPERFRYAPFRAGLDRWFNRDVAAGWGWGGTQDVGGYNSEQILATSHFRIYRALGGDSADVARRWHASRVMTYLIVRTVGGLTPATNPSTAQLWCDKLIATNLLDWTSEGLAGGAYGKVIRWSFEKQGLYQPLGTPSPVTTAGAPPAVDVYIEDGRHGEYQYQPVHWANESVWNRQAADGGTAHQDAIPGVPNFAYVKVKNRGTSAAANVTVRGYHCLPGAGLVWPTDFTQMSPVGGLAAASIGANNSQEVVLGPFMWTPNANVYGHDCMLMIATTGGDPSNIDNFTPGESIAEWRLVPHDNNIGQRNVQLVAGGGGPEALIASLHERVFYAGNTLRRRAEMSVHAQLPAVLSDRGWALTFRGVDGLTFDLAAGEKRQIGLVLVPGADFGPEDVAAADDRDIVVSVHTDGMLVGGMSYRLDPNRRSAPGAKGDRDEPCTKAATDLLKCLDLPTGKVSDVCVTKVSLDVRFEHGCEC